MAGEEAEMLSVRLQEPGKTASAAHRYESSLDPHFQYLTGCPDLKLSQGAKPGRECKSHLKTLFSLHTILL